MRVSTLLADLTFGVDRINGVRDALTERAGLRASDPLRVQLNNLAAKADEIRKKIVATKEGGAITARSAFGEKPLNCMARSCFMKDALRIITLRASIRWRTNARMSFVAKDLEAANASLAAKKLEAIRPPTRAAWEKANVDAESGGSGVPKEPRLSQ